MRSLFLVSEIHWHGNRIVLIIDFSSFIPLAAGAQLKAGNWRESSLQVDLRIKKIQMENVLARSFVIFISAWSLLSGCADTKQAAEPDSNSIFHKSESDPEVHGEVGAMYGHTAR
jgi:hypothetical protein